MIDEYDRHKRIVGRESPALTRTTTAISELLAVKKTDLLEHIGLYCIFSDGRVESLLDVASNFQCYSLIWCCS